jgi:hypothetical protein
MVIHLQMSNYLMAAIVDTTLPSKSVNASKETVLGVTAARISGSASQRASATQSRDNNNTPVEVRYVGVPVG